MGAEQKMSQEEMKANLLALSILMDDEKEKKELFYLEKRQVGSVSF